MNDLMSLGLSALMAYRSALSAVGENVANAETPGFTRRSVRLTPGAADRQSDPVYRDQVAFQGVVAAEVQRGWDMFRATEARSAAAGAGRTGVREQWLTGIESALGDGPAGVGSKLTGFFNAAESLAAEPGDTFGRSRLLMSIDEVAASFRATADSLRRLSSGVSTSAQVDVDEANATLQALERVNTNLLVTAEGTSARASLEDERDRLIDRLAEKIEVNVTIGSHGTARVTLADSPSTTLVSLAESSRFGLSQTADGRLSLSIVNDSGSTNIDPSTGKFAGFLDMADTIADRREALDTLAVDFAAEVNAWSAAGRDRAGNPGQPLIEVTAGAASMRGLVSDPAAVPAASAAGVPNGNLLALGALRGETGAERRWANMVTGHAQILAAAKSEHSATVAWRDNARAALDEVTGVDLDREAADLIRFQQAYSAAARIVQAGRETIDTILKI